jgi:hypothetical protein
MGGRGREREREGRIRCDQSRRRHARKHPLSPSHSPLGSLSPCSVQQEANQRAFHTAYGIRRPLKTHAKKDSRTRVCPSVHLISFRNGTHINPTMYLYAVPNSSGPWPSFHLSQGREKMSLRFMKLFSANRAVASILMPEITTLPWISLWPLGRALYRSLLLTAIDSLISEARPVWPCRARLFCLRASTIVEECVPTRDQCREASPVKDQIALVIVDGDDLSPECSRKSVGPYIIIPTSPLLGLLLIYLTFGLLTFLSERT